MKYSFDTLKTVKTTVSFTMSVTKLLNYLHLRALLLN